MSRHTPVQDQEQRIIDEMNAFDANIGAPPRSVIKRRLDARWVNMVRENQLSVETLAMMLVDFEVAYARRGHAVEACESVVDAWEDQNDGQVVPAPVQACMDAIRKAVTNELP